MLGLSWMSHDQSDEVVEKLVNHKCLIVMAATDNA